MGAADANAAASSVRGEKTVGIGGSSGIGVREAAEGAAAAAAAAEDADAATNAAGAAVISTSSASAVFFLLRGLLAAGTDAAGAGGAASGAAGAMPSFLCKILPMRAAKKEPTVIHREAAAEAAVSAVAL